MKKIREMMQEAEKQRIPIAQGLPWTTDEPEVSIDTFTLCYEVKSIKILHLLFLILFRFPVFD